MPKWSKASAAALLMLKAKWTLSMLIYVKGDPFIGKQRQLQEGRILQLPATTRNEGKNLNQRRPLAALDIYRKRIERLFTVFLD